MSVDVAWPGPVPSGHYQLEVQLGRFRHWTRLDLGLLNPGQAVLVVCEEAFGVCLITK